MKRYRSIIKMTGIVIMLFNISGCNEDFLELEPTDRITTSDFYQNEEDAVAAVNFAYAALVNGEGSGAEAQDRSVYGRFLGILDIYSDNALINATHGGVGAPSWLLKEGNPMTAASWDNPVSQFWLSSYTLINRANSVITHAEPMEIDETVKKQVIAQAKFLRALSYFNLVRFYGDVPLKLSPTESLDEEIIHLSRAPLQDIYVQIITDLKEAANDLPDIWTGKDLGRATAGAANGLLAKVYLTLATRDYGNRYTKDGQEYENAALYSKKVIDKVPAVYDLMPDYSQLFAPDLSGENCKESVFEVQYEGLTLRGGIQTIYYAPPDSWGAVITGGWGWSLPTTEFVSLYEPADSVRKSTTIWSHGDTWDYAADGVVTYTYDSSISLTGHHTKKYICYDQYEAWFSGSLNLHILRLAEIYLIYAEARLHTGSQADADHYVNLVRERAGVTEISNVTDEDIWRERRIELAFECDRYFDLLRTNRLISVMNTQKRADGETNIQLNARNLYWPVPEEELDQNPNMIQTEGY